jgi:excinuclease ABC subunit C
VVDGGRGQLGVATTVLQEAGLDIPVIGLAKRLEEVFVPGEPEPLRIPRTSEALFVLQHLRDEAHRFAITYHRQKRGKRALASPLDDIPGVGPSRKRALLRRFGSLTRLREASADEIAGTDGIGTGLAADIHERLHAVADRPGRRDHEAAEPAGRRASA